jgi:hypothetical protein
MDIRLPELKLNGITNDHCFSVSPHFGNAAVTCWAFFRQDKMHM